MKTPVRKKIVFFTGAGVSKESGLSTFRDPDGIWMKYPPEYYATVEALYTRTAEVLDFYNQRRRNVLNARPNPAHEAMAKLESSYEVVVITQNVDDLHERAGSTRVIHLHGLITQNKCMCPVPHLYDIDPSRPETIEIRMGQLCEKGSQLRHNVVLFGEAVENLDIALNEIVGCDVLVVVGTSLQVYPAAGLVMYAPSHAVRICIDPGDVALPPGFYHIRDVASSGTTRIMRALLEKPEVIFNRRWEDFEKIFGK